MNEPKIKVARLFEKTSQGGKRYFMGRWGGARILLFKDDRSEVEGEWSLFLQEIPPDQQGVPGAPAGAQRGDGAGTAPRNTAPRNGYQNRAQAAKPAPSGDPMPDDPLPCGE